MGEAGEAKHAVWPNGDMTTVRIRQDVGSVRIGVDDGTDYWALTVKVDQAVWLRDALTELCPRDGETKANESSLAVALRELELAEHAWSPFAPMFADKIGDAVLSVRALIEQAEGKAS